MILMHVADASQRRMTNSVKNDLTSFNDGWTPVRRNLGRKNKSHSQVWGGIGRTPGHRGENTSKRAGLGVWPLKGQGDVRLENRPVPGRRGVRPGVTPHAPAHLGAREANFSQSV